MSAAIQFKKAIKFEAKGRVSLIGPAGSGKSYTGLVLAKMLAGDKRIAAIDTEHGSLSKYADMFDFDVIEPDGFSTDSWLSALTAAEDAGYGVFMTDSLSHYWMGRDGALEFVDNASKRFKDQMGGWKEFSPLERAMIDRMIASPCHIICTMRTKTEYVEEINAQGKKVRKKVGLAPVQRQGLEFEFDLVAYMDDENVLITDKTRCSHYAKKTIASPKEKDFKPFVDWLKGEKRTEPIAIPEDSRPIDIGSHTSGTKAAQQHVLNQKLKAFPAPAPVITDDFLERLATATRAQLMVAVTTLITEQIPRIFSTEEGAQVIHDAKARFGGKSFKDLTDDQARELANILYSSVDVKQKMILHPDEEQFPPDALLVLWEEMTDIASTVRVFQGLHDKLLEFMDGAAAEKIYRAALKHQGVAHSNQFKGDKTKGARPALREIFEALQAAKRVPVEEITDADIPR